MFEDLYKVEFLFDATEIGLEASVLKQIAKLDTLYSTPRKQLVRTEDYQVGNTRLAVTLSKNEVHWLNNYHNKVFNNLKKFMNKSELIDLKKSCSNI